MGDYARRMNRNSLDDEVERLNDRELLRVILRRENKVLDVVERLTVDQRHLQIAVEELLVQNENLLCQQKRLQDENTTLRKEVAIIRRIGETVPRFNCFMKLPPEIRFRIWALAIPCRFVRLELREETEEMHEGEEGLDKGSKHLPPAVSQVCQEARAIAVRDAGFRAIQYGCRNFFPTGWSIPMPWRREWTWFDSARDTFMVPTWMTGSEYPDYLHLTKVVRHVFVEDLEGGLGAALKVLFDPLVYPSLRSVSFVMDRKLDHLADIPAPSSSTNQRFPPDSPYEVVDIEHLEHSVDAEWPKTKAHYDDQNWILENYPDDEGFEEIDDESVMTWPEFLGRLAVMWESQRGRDPLPWFRRVAVLSNVDQRARGPAKYLTN